MDNIENHFPIFALPKEIVYMVLKKLKMGDRLNLRLTSRFLSTFLIDTKIVAKCEIDQNVLFLTKFIPREKRFAATDIEISSFGMPKRLHHAIVKGNFKENDMDYTMSYPSPRDLLDKAFSPLPSSLRSLRVRVLGTGSYKNPVIKQTIKEICDELEGRKFRIGHVIFESKENFVFIPLLRTMIRLGCKHFDMNMVQSMESGLRLSNFKDWIKIPLAVREPNCVMRRRCTQEPDMSNEEFISIIRMWYYGEIAMCNVEFSVVLEEFSEEEAMYLSLFQSDAQTVIRKFKNADRTSEISMQSIIQYHGKEFFAVWTSKPAECPRISYFDREKEIWLIKNTPKKYLWRLEKAGCLAQ